MVKAPSRRFSRAKTPQFKAKTTMPKEHLRHSIADEELTLLTKLRSGKLIDGMWAALGAAVGTAPNALGVAGRAIWQENPAPLLVEDYVLLVFFVLSLGAGLSLLWSTKNLRCDTDDLVAEIRSRPKIPIQ